MDLRSKLAGLKDPRGMQGMMSRGTNIYPGGSKAAQKGSYSRAAKIMLARASGNRK